MSRRKGELSPGTVDRDWPHQVIIPDFRGEMWMSRWPSACPRHHSVVKNDQCHRIYCFADPADAADFVRIFGHAGARPFDPKTRGRGRRWSLIKAPK